MAAHAPARPRLPAIAVLLAAGFALRLVLAWLVFPGKGLPADLGFFTSWASSLAAAGPASFYATAPSANYPPGSMLVLWVIGLLARFVASVTGSPERDVLLALVKIPAILADLAIAALVFRAARGWHGERAALAGAALYLFVPVTWYDSAIWGQVDALVAFVMLASILLLIDGWSEAAVALAVLAVLVKPQGLVALAIVGPVLLRRHLLRPALGRWLHLAPGPVPVLGPHLARVDAALDGLLTRRQGPERLISAALAGLLVAALVVLPFDIQVHAPAALADVPLVGQLAGVVGLVAKDAGQFPDLTANAYNLWALAGPRPLVVTMATDGFTSRAWTPDSALVLGALSGFALGAVALVGTGLLVALRLLVADGRRAILFGFTVVAIAFYLLPTRAHERYLLPAFAPAALIAAGSAAWSGWYAMFGLLNVVNLHAVLTAAARFAGTGGEAPGSGGPGAPGPGGPLVGPGGFGSGSIAAQLPLGDLARARPVIVAVVVGQTCLFLVLVLAWLRDRVPRPTRAAVSSGDRDRS